tara:strand:- start:643 stop:834 length:192 start_codon:yes stop_codon:yes gene_type:complete
MSITTNEEAYLRALVLSVTAPTEEKSIECIQLAESIGSLLTEKQRDLCKQGAELAMEISRGAK